MAYVMNFKMLKQIKKSNKKILAIRSKHTLPDLPYDYNGLEPVINTEIMKLHHSKHHQTYVTNLNIIEEQLHEAVNKNDVKSQIKLQSGLNFNGGGHLNHSIFWENLCPIKNGGGELQKGDLSKAIDEEFGSFDNFVAKFNAMTVAVQGSGWGWLGYCKNKKKLDIIAKTNQDPLTEMVPLLGIDVWEHAYYLKYKNVRADYLKEIWKVINWKDVEKRYKDSKK